MRFPSVDVRVFRQDFVGQKLGRLVVFLCAALLLSSPLRAFGAQNVANEVWLDDFAAPYGESITNAGLYESWRRPVGMEAHSARLQTPWMRALGAAMFQRDLPPEAIWFYQSRDMAPVWFESGIPLKRARDLIGALQGAGAHGLPPARYNAAALQARMEADFAASDAALAALELDLTAAYLLYARDVGYGLTEPARGRGFIAPAPFDAGGLMRSAAYAADFSIFLRSLPPRDAAYWRLKAKLADYTHLAALNGFGHPVKARMLRFGQSSAEIALLRRRLAMMGDLQPEPEMALLLHEAPSEPASANAAYDERLREAVAAFQRRHGLKDDGVAGPRTLKAINAPIEQRIAQIIVNMERLRWRNRPLGERYILVNLAAFEMRLIDQGEEVFHSPVVIGESENNRQTPEFSERMRYMVLNPRWNVPNSIAVNEILPELQADANYLNREKMTLHGANGETLDPLKINWAEYGPQRFPFAIRQTPGAHNALGRVKFMFPNPYNIYLHDTPAKSYFRRARRDFSHGCVRVGKPEALAHAILQLQNHIDEEEARRLYNEGPKLKGERIIPLQSALPVHIIYQTAWVDARGALHFREDIYERNQTLARAMMAITPNG